MSAHRHVGVLPIAVGLAIGIFPFGSRAQVAEGQGIDTGENARQSVKTVEEVASSTRNWLGVTVTDSPGEGVLVTAVPWGGPAAHADIRSGDFILTVADQSIEIPADLHRAVQRADPSTELAIGYWRDGTRLSVSVSLASRFPQPVREKAWLGVMLEMTEGGQVLVADVVPASPAARGGMRVGDSIVRVDATSVDSANEVMQLLEKIKGGDDVDVTVLRDGAERTFTVRVGSAVQGTMRWFRERFPRDDLGRFWSEFAPRDAAVDGYLESFEGMLERLRGDVGGLREEVQRLRGEMQLKKYAPIEATPKQEPKPAPSEEKGADSKAGVSEV